MTNLKLYLMGEIFDFVFTAFWPSFPSFTAINTQLDINGSHLLELHFLFQKRFFIFGAFRSPSSSMLLSIVRRLRILLNILFLNPVAMLVIVRISVLIVIVIKLIIKAQILLFLLLFLLELLYLLSNLVVLLAGDEHPIGLLLTSDLNLGLIANVVNIDFPQDIKDDSGGVGGGFLQVLS